MKTINVVVGNYIGDKNQSIVFTKIIKCDHCNRHVNDFSYPPEKVFNIELDSKLKIPYPSADLTIGQIEELIKFLKEVLINERKI